MAHNSGSVDANILLRLGLNDIPDQRETVKRLLTTLPDQLVVADASIIEVVFVLGRHYGFKRIQSAKLVNELLSLRWFVSNDVLIKQSLKLFVSHPSLSFEDCYLAANASVNNAQPLWTFNKKLASQASSAKLVPVIL